jgi:hypothetical protein
MSLAMELLRRADPVAADPTPLESAVALEWSFNPWRERRVRSSVAAIALLAICILLSRLGESLVLTLGLSLAAAGGLAPLLSPSGCRLDAEGVAVRGVLGWERRRWSELRRAWVTAGGVMCSPYAAPNWLDAHRGLFLPLPRAPRGELLSGIRPRLARHGL